MILVIFKLDYGEDVWQKVVEMAECPHHVFNTHQLYSDNIIKTLATACEAVIPTESYDFFMEYFGRCFVRYCANWG